MKGRLKERRVQSLFPSFGLSRDPYLVSIQALVANQADTKTVEADIMAAVRTFHDTLVDPGMLAATKSSIKYSFLMAMESAQEVAFAGMQSIVSTGRLESIEDYYRTLDAVTPEDLREAARKYLVEHGRTTITMVQEN